MVITEVKQDLFTVPQDYYLAHCVSGDYALGAGIAKVFDKKYNMRFKLNRDYPIPKDKKFANVGKALLIDKVFNIVTKQRYFHKPTYKSLFHAVYNMKEQCEELHIDKLAMPRIGCGLDRLEWQQVKTIIEGIFYNTDIEILVCYL